MDMDTQSLRSFFFFFFLFYRFSSSVSIAGIECLSYGYVCFAVTGDIILVGYICFVAHTGNKCTIHSFFAKSNNLCLRF